MSMFRGGLLQQQHKSEFADPGLAGGDLLARGGDLEEELGSSEDEEPEDRSAELEFFGCDPLQVMEDVINFVEHYLCEGLDSLEVDVLSAASPMLKKVDPKQQQRLKDKIKEGVDEICNLLQPSVAQHMDGFEEHVLEAILKVPRGLAVPNTTHSVFSEQTSALPHSGLFLRPTPQHRQPSPPLGLLPGHRQLQPAEHELPLLSLELLQQQEAQLDAEIGQLMQQLRLVDHRQRLVQTELGQLQTGLGDFESNVLAGVLGDPDPVDRPKLDAVTRDAREVMREARLLQRIAPPDSLQPVSANPSTAGAGVAATADAPDSGPRDGAEDVDEMFYSFDDSAEQMRRLPVQDLLAFGHHPHHHHRHP